MEELRIPGPTPCPPEVLEAMTKQMINHRGKEFSGMLKEVTEKLKLIFQTRNDLFLLSSSGSGGMEAAVVNTLSPGDKVLSVSNGAFAERFASIARIFGGEVSVVKFDWGKPVDAEAVRQALRASPDIKAVLVTHNETSTGITNDLAAISSVVKEAGKLLMVDAISSMGSIDIPVDKWHIDVALSASQKGWMAPPGMAMITVSQEAWAANAKARMPRFYWDLAQAKKYAGIGQTPWTPAITVVYALSVSLDMMLKEGLPGIVARHARVARAARDGAKGLGLSLFADEKYASNTVTAVSASNGLDSKKMLKLLEEEYHLILGDGQAQLDGKIFRIGHLGWVTESDIKKALSMIKTVLPQCGFVKPK